MKRGMTPETQENFGIGYAGSAQGLISSLKKWGINKKEIPISIGLLKEKQKGLTCPFMSRITLPIFDQSRNVVGFGGRAADDGQQVKYINSSDSQIFSKRRCLFGLNRVEPIDGTIVLVEGFFDVLTLHQAGFKNAVGLLGTELSHEQAGILERLGQSVTLIFDGDQGGQKALLKTVKAPLQGLNARAVLLPEGDPDDLVRKRGAKELETLIDKAPGIREAAIEIIGQRVKSQRIEDVVEETAQIASEIPDSVEASLFAEQAAGSLGVPGWVLQEKTHERRGRKEKIYERKKALERFVIEELLRHPSINDPETLRAVADLFEEGEEKRLLLKQTPRGE